MDLALLQPVADTRAVPRAYRDEVAVLAGRLRAAGHRVSLLLLAPTDEAALAAPMPGARCDLVLMYVEPLALDVAVRAAGGIASTHGVPVVAFGPHARRCPDECLSLTGAEAVAVGRGDFVVEPYVAARGRSLDSLRTPGLWVKCETGVMRNPVGKPPDLLAGRPPPARDLYPPECLLDTAGFAPVTAAIGGEGETTGPPAPGEPPWVAASAWPVRHRPAGEVLREMRALADKQLDLGGFRVGDERWLASPAFLGEFAERYRKEIALPLRTTLYAPDVKEQAASLLARAGCEEAVLPFGSASGLIRNEILRLNISAEQLVSAFDALRRAGVRTVARVEVGTPYETPVTLDETVSLLERLDPDRVEAVLHYPEPGSYAAKVARENGWLVPNPAAAHLAGQPALVPPGLSAKQIATACELLPYRVHRPRIVPLLRAARRVRMGRRGTAYDVLVKPFLAPPMRRRT